MHNCRSTRQQQLQKEEITQNRSDNESLSFRSITKIAAIHNPHTTQEITERKQVVCRVVDHNYPHPCGGIYKAGNSLFSALVAAVHTFLNGDYATWSILLRCA